MSQETVYLKLAQITELYEPDVILKDIADVHCQNKSVETRMKAMKVTKFQKPKRKQTGIYVGSVMGLVKDMEAIVPNIQVVNLGEADFIVKYRPNAGGNVVIQWLKTIFIACIAFCGAAFAIMTFNNDANVTDVFANIYYLTMGMESNGKTILEFSYSLGITIGILVFFNHFAKWKLTVDPTPIEVEMRLYEENLNKTVIQNHGRKERGIDVF